MPSIRKRLKKLTSSKKSKSTTDLDQMRPTDLENSTFDHRDDDTCSQVSEAVSERTDASAMTNEDSSYSFTASGEKKKKKHRLRLSFPRRKKKEKQLPDGSGNALFRSLSVEHDPRGNSLHTRRSFTEEDDGNASLKPDTLDSLSRSVGNIDEEEENPEVDNWRMSGLLESVDRASAPSSTHDLSSGKDNLISTFEERRKQTVVPQPNHASTPLKDDEEKEDDVTKESTAEGKIIAFIKPVSIEVSFTDKKNDSEEPFTETEDLNYEYSSDARRNQDGTDATDMKPPKYIKLAVDEEILEEFRNEDQKCEIEFKEENGVPETKPEKDLIDSVVCEIGQGKKVIIRHLSEVVRNGNLKLSENVSADDWLVLNMIKDDWIVVGYSKVGGQVTNLFEQSVEAVY